MARGDVRSAKRHMRRLESLYRVRVVQNVGAMRPEVRDDYVAVLARIGGDAPFRTRLERWFTELRDPLVRVYGEAFPLGELAGRDRRDRRGAHARAARARPRARDHAGLAAPRAAARLRRLRRPLRRHAGRRARADPVPARAGRGLPAPDAAAAGAAGAQRRRLRGRRLRRRRARARDDGRPARARLGAARGRDGAVRRRRAQPHGARARVGARGDRRRPADARPLPDLRAAPGALRARAARRVPGHRARKLHVRARARPLGLDDVQRLPVGPRLLQPRRVHGDGAGDARPRDRRRRCAAARRGAVHLEARGHGLPEPAGGARAAGRAARGVPDRRAGDRVQGRGDRGAARPRAVPARVRPRVPQRPDGAAVVDAGVRQGRADDQLAAGDAAGGRLAHLRALPRRHRLGDRGRGRRRGRRGRLPAPPVPRRLLRGRVPGLVRARRALPGRAHERHDRVVWPASTATRSWRCGACWPCTRSRSRSAGCR